MIIPKPNVVGTLTYLLQMDDGVEKVCLAWKERTENAVKRKLADKWNSYGGGYEPKKDVSIEATAVREPLEESGVIILQQDLEKVAEIIYVNPWGVYLCHYFLVRKFLGEPRASSEMGKPAWFPKKMLPKPMMDSDSYVLPKIFDNKKFRAVITHDEDMIVVKFEIEYVDHF